MGHQRILRVEICPDRVARRQRPVPPSRRKESPSPGESPRAWNRSHQRRRGALGRRKPYMFLKAYSNHKINPPSSGRSHCPCSRTFPSSVTAEDTCILARAAASIRRWNCQDQARNALPRGLRVPGGSPSRTVRTGYNVRAAIDRAQLLDPFQQFGAPEPIWPRSRNTSHTRSFGFMTAHQSRSRAFIGEFESSVSHPGLTWNGLARPTYPLANRSPFGTRDVRIPAAMVSGPAPR